MGRTVRGLTLAGAFTVLAATAALAAQTASAGGYGVPDDPVAADCQPLLDDQPCLQPFPNNLFTKGANTPTGRRVKLPADAMPVNTEGVAIDPAEWNRNDGFSPGSMITVHVPGLDTPQALQNTGPVPLADLSKYKRRNAPVVVIDQDTGKRWPIWVELDSNAATPEATNLLIHPAKNFKAKHRYTVALRDLEDAAGNAIAAPRWFELLRDGGNLPGELGDQSKRYRSIFEALRKAGIERDNGLYEAWNFTVASRRDRTARLLEDPGRRLRAARRPKSRRRRGERVGAAVPGNRDRRERSNQRGRSDAGPERSARRARQPDGALLPGRGRVPAGSQLQLRFLEARRASDPDRGQRRQRRVRVRHPARRSGCSRASGPVWPRAARVGERFGRDGTTSARWPPSTTSSSAAWTHGGCLRRTSPTTSPRFRT